MAPEVADHAVVPVMVMAVPKAEAGVGAPEPLDSTGAGKRCRSRPRSSVTVDVAAGLAGLTAAVGAPITGSVLSMSNSTSISAPQLPAASLPCRHRWCGSDGQAVDGGQRDVSADRFRQRAPRTIGGHEQEARSVATDGVDEALGGDDVRGQVGDRSGDPCSRRATS